MLSNHLPIASEYGGENDRKTHFFGECSSRGCCVDGRTEGRTPHTAPATAQAGTTICPTAFGVVGAPARCARQHLDGNLGWGCSQDASHRGNSHVERDQTGQHWELGPVRLHGLAAALPLSGNSFKYIYIYKIKSCFIYICISISVLSPWIPLSIHPHGSSGPVPSSARVVPW